MQPKYVVITPVRNEAGYIEMTLTSMIAQTVRPAEWIIVNDGSTDAHSIAVFRQMQSRFPQFRFVEQINAGIGATRNRGLGEARGAYFLPVDAGTASHRAERLIEEFFRVLLQRFLPLKIGSNCGPDGREDDAALFFQLDEPGCREIGEHLFCQTVDLFFLESHVPSGCMPPAGGCTGG